MRCRKVKLYGQVSKQRKERENWSRPASFPIKLHKIWKNFFSLVRVRPLGMKWFLDSLGY